MNLEIIGKLIEKYETQVVSDRFKKREFVLELVEEVNGSPYTNYAKMQLVQNKCDILDRFNVGDVLRVNFNIKGNRYEKEGRTSYFSNLDAWRLEKADVNANANNGSNGGNNNYNAGNNNAGNTQGNTGGFNNNNNSNNGGGWGSNGNNNNSGFQNSNSNAPVQNSSTADTADDLPF
jgi:hypothetical protein